MVKKFNDKMADVLRKDLEAISVDLKKQLRTKEALTRDLAFNEDNILCLRAISNYLINKLIELGGDGLEINKKIKLEKSK